MVTKPQQDQINSRHPQETVPPNRALSERIYTTEWVPLPQRTTGHGAGGIAGAKTWILLPSPSTLTLSAQWAERIRKEGGAVREVQVSAVGLSSGDEIAKLLVETTAGQKGGRDETEIVVFAGEECLPGSRGLIYERIAPMW